MTERVTLLEWLPILEARALPPVGTEESEYLDFKSKPWDGTEKDKCELARDVMQFANHLGGSIIIGAEEDGQDCLMGYANVPNAQRIIVSVADTCHARLSPRIAVHPLVVQVGAGLQVVVVNVAAHDGVVAARVQDGRWEFFRRHGKGKRPLTFEQVEDMWTEGRRGKLMLLKIPLEQGSGDRRRAFVDAVASDAAFLRGQCVITLYADHFELKLANSQNFGLPYEFVRAVWRGSEDQWFVSLTARFEHRTPENMIRVGYSP